MKKTFKTLAVAAALAVVSITPVLAEDMKEDYDHFSYWVGESSGSMEIKPILNGLNPGGAASILFVNEWASIDMDAYEIIIDGVDKTNEASVTLTNKGGGRYDFFINYYYETSIIVNFNVQRKDFCGDFSTVFASKVTGGYDKEGYPVAKETKDIFNHKIDCGEWVPEGGYPTDPDTGNEWEIEAGKEDWKNDREEEDKEIIDKETEWEDAWNNVGNSVPMTPLEPATPVKPDIPLTPLEPSTPVKPEETPLAPLEPSKPIEKPEEPKVDDKEEEVEKETVVEKPSEKPKEDIVEKPVEKEEVSTKTVKEEVVEEASSASKDMTNNDEVVEVLPPTGEGISTVQIVGSVFVALGAIALAFYALEIKIFKKEN